jgi:hypothetical protein
MLAEVVVVGATRMELTTVVLVVQVAAAKVVLVQQMGQPELPIAAVVAVVVGMTETTIVEVMVDRVLQSLPMLAGNEAPEVQ